MKQNLKKLSFVAILLTLSLSAMAQKALYIPNEWKYDASLYQESDPNNQAKWSKSRSKESENVIVYWDNGYGNTNPSNAADTYRVDIDDLLAKCEQFYAKNVNELGFHVGNHDKYKMMVLLNYTTEWMCYGSGYDYVISALWLSPSTCHPVGSSVAHEVGHSFHYMAYGGDSNYGATPGIETGFHNNWSGSTGQAIWEQTAQWQAFQSYPYEMFTDLGAWDYFSKASNYAFSHEWIRYQSFWLHYYLCEKYNDITTISKVWKTHETTPKDFCQVLMDYKGLSVDDFYRLYFDYAMHMATLDIQELRTHGGNSKIGTYRYDCVSLGSNKYQVAYSSAPQSTGFNVIPLNVPTAGTEITTKFTALNTGSSLAANDSKTYFDEEGGFSTASVNRYNSANNSIRGFRVGYVALKKDGTREYISTDQRIGTASSATADVKCTVPANTSKLYLVVVPALSEYVRHDWNQVYTDDDQWPYTVEFTNTSLAGVTVLDGRDVANVTFNYDVKFPASDYDYAGISVTLGAEEKAMLGTAFQMQWSDIAGKLDSYSAGGPSDGKIMFYAANADGSLQESASTANGYGHWVNPSGTVTNWGNNSCAYSEFAPATMTFTIGQMPGVLGSGKTYPIHQALRYKDINGKEAIAYFNFNITIAPTASYELTSTDYEGGSAPEEPEIKTYSYDVQLPVTKNEYVAKYNFAVKNELLEGLDMSETEFATAYSAGNIHFYGVNADGSMHTSGFTANAGYWYNESGDVTTWDWGVSQSFAEFDPSALTFNLGEMPSQVSVGTANTISVAFVSDSGKSVKLSFNLSFTQMPNLVLSDDETSRNVEAGLYNVTISRQFSKDKWLTFCTPFNIYEGDFATYGITEAKRLTGLTHEGESVDLQFGYGPDGDKTIWVGIPYIIKVSEDMTGMSKESFIVQPTDCQTTVSDGTYSCTMHGNATKTTLPLGAYYISNNNFYYTTTSTNTMKGFRSYFTLDGGTQSAKSITLSILNDTDDTTEVLQLTSDGSLIDANANVYALTGQMVKKSGTSDLQKGVYIINGKKIIVK